MPAYKSNVERISANFVGRVQGVGFRATARSIAARHGLSGWVRNESDGSVQLEVQGPSEVLNAFLASLRAQMGSFIRTSQVCPIPLQEGERGFAIHH